MNDLINLAAPLAGGGICGFCVGWSIKRIVKFALKIVALAVGALFTAIMFMQWKGYITGSINWDKMGADIINTTQQFAGQVDTGNITNIFGQIGIPATSGFVVGFMVGMRR